MINITIKGTVDAKRLERAFQEALNRYVDYYGDDFDAFYDVELLLKAKNTEGVDVYLQDSLPYTHESKSLFDEPCFYIEFPAPFEGETTVDNESYSDDEYEYDRTALHEEYINQQHERQIEQQKQHDEMMLLQSELDNQFTLIFSHLGDGIIDEFNDAIKEIWAEQKPIATNGKHKGHTSFMPFFEINNKLTRPLRLVTSSSNLRGKGILNPLYEATWKKILIPIHDTVIWRMHVLPKLEKIMGAYHFATTPTN